MAEYTLQWLLAGGKEWRISEKDVTIVQLEEHLWAYGESKDYLYKLICDKTVVLDDVYIEAVKKWVEYAVQITDQWKTYQYYNFPAQQDSLYKEYNTNQLKETKMAKQLFEYAVVYNPPRVVNNQGTDVTPSSVVVLEPKTVLASNDAEVRLLIGRALPEEYLDKVDDLIIRIKPF